MIIGNQKMINAKNLKLITLMCIVSWNGIQFNSIQAFFDISLNFPRFCMLYDTFTVLYSLSMPSFTSQVIEWFYKLINYTAEWAECVTHRWHLVCANSTKGKLYHKRRFDPSSPEKKIKWMTDLPSLDYAFAKKVNLYNAWFAYAAVNFCSQWFGYQVLCAVTQA